nr:hypothetical protein [Tanacetum cinerariifolium]
MMKRTKRLVKAAMKLERVKVKVKKKKKQESRLSEEARIQEEEDAEELYRDVNINQGRGLQVTQNVEDTHVILTLVNPNGPQESSSMSSFTSSMLNPLSDVGVESIFTKTSSPIVSIEPPTPIMTPYTIATITTSGEAPIPPPTIPSIILENLPTFNSAFRFKERLRLLETSFSEYKKTNQFADAVSTIPGIVHQTPEDSKDDGNGEEDQGLKVSEEQRLIEEEEADELYRDVDIKQGRGLQVSQYIEDSHVTLTPVQPDGQQESSSVSSFVTSMLNPISDAGVKSIFTTASSSIAPIQTSTPIMNPSTIATITTSSEAPIPPTTIPSAVLKNLPTFDTVFRFKDRVKSLEVNFSEFTQTNQFAEAVSKIPGEIEYMDQQMKEAVREVVQIQTDRLQDSLQRENDEFLRNIDENMKKVLKGLVKNQVKEQVSRILPRIEESVNATLEAEVLTRSSQSSRTSYAIAADLSEMELKKILIEKMEGNKSIQRSDEQRNLYKALVEAYDADKAILDTYGDSTILKRKREDDDQEGPSVGSDRGSKRKKEGGEHASASTPSEKATKGAGGSTTGEEQRLIEEEEADELYRDVDIKQGWGLQVSQYIEDSHVTLTPVQPDGQQESSSVLSFVTSMLNLISDADKVKSLEVNFSEFTQTNQFAEATDRLQDSFQRENDEFLRTIDDNMKKIINGQVKSQVKEQVSRILTRIEESVNAQLEAEVLTRSSHSLTEMEQKKILIEKMEGNKSIQRSNKQRNLYKALVDAYEADKTILESYGDTAILMRRRGDDDDQEGPSAGSDRGSKRRREGGKPELARTPSEPATRSASRSTTGTQSRQMSANAKDEEDHEKFGKVRWWTTV